MLLNIAICNSIKIIRHMFVTTLLTVNIPKKSHNQIYHVRTKNNLLCHVVHTAMCRRSSVVKQKRQRPVIVVCLQDVPRAAVCTNVPYVKCFLA